MKVSKSGFAGRNPTKKGSAGEVTKRQAPGRAEYQRKVRKVKKRQGLASVRVHVPDTYGDREKVKAYAKKLVKRHFEVNPDLADPKKLP